MRGRRGIVGAVAMAVGLSGGALVATAATAQAAPEQLPVVLEPIDGVPAGLSPVDPQDVDDFNEMTWDDFVPVPGKSWADPNLQPTVKRWKAALVLVDYPDQRFVVTQPAGSTPFGTPSPAAANIPRSQVPEFYRDLLNTPSELNNYHTINEYWMEDTNGRYGVEFTAFGVYEMPKASYRYHYNSYGNGGTNPATKCPTSLGCTGNNFRNDALALWRADTGLANPAANFDNIFYLGAGNDQSATWLEFGQMMFETPEDIPDSFGPPLEWRQAVKAATGLDAPNWSPTRYVAWTSWAAAASMWPNASGNTSIEAENSGKATYAHELSHNLSIADNYGNPYAVNPRRDQSGAWDMMSRGSFNGPGGPHMRWNIPALLGDVMGSQHMLRDKMFLNVVPSTAVVNVTRSGLGTNGVAVTSVTARAVQIPGQKVGINVALDGSGDLSTCASQGYVGDTQWLCDSNSNTGVRGNYNNYTLEVVDQMGQDSFTADSGVLLAKTKNTGSPNKWTIDANEEDIDLIDYYMADGTPVKVGRGDHRQLNDALFKAGSNSGSAFEYVDADNNLHFYVLDKKRDENGILSYDVAVRNTAATSAVERGVSLGSATVADHTPGEIVSCVIPLTNTGASVSNALYNKDVFRIGASVSGSGWTTWLPYQVVAAAAGGSTNVTVYAVKGEEAADSATVTLTATSESDPSKSATRTCSVGEPDLAPTVTVTADPATANGAAGWYTSSVTVSAAATDDNDASPAVEVNVNGAGFAAYTAPVVVSAEGTTTLEFRATDSAANVSDVVTWTGKIDTVAPMTSGSVDLTDDATGVVTLTASDATSGVASTEYRIGTGAWIAYTAPVSVIRGSDAVTVEFRSTDNAGLVETAQQVEVPAAPVTVVSSTTTLTITPSAVPVTAGSVTAVVTVTAASGLGTETVSILDGTTVVGTGVLSGTATSASATIVLSGLTVGTKNLVAKYPGAATVEASDSAAATIQVHFTDVLPSNRFFEDVQWLATAGITTGYANGTFNATGPVTRQDMAVFLYRLTHPGQPIPACTTAPFTDVSASGQFCGAIAWLASTGVTTGDNGKFKPNDNVSRQAMAAFLFRLTNPGQTAPACTTKPFTDVAVTNQFCAEIKWMATSGLTTLTSAEAFQPAGVVTRQAMASFLHKWNQLFG